MPEESYMEGYKIRQSIEFGTGRAAILKVFTNLEIYEDLIVAGHETFQRNEDIIEIGLYLCWDNQAGLSTEACLLRRWQR